MTRDGRGCCVEVGVIAGYDPATVDASAPDYARSLGMQAAKHRLGEPRATFERIDPEQPKGWTRRSTFCASLRASVTDVQLPPAVNPANIWGPENVRTSSEMA